MKGLLLTGDTIVAGADIDLDLGGPQVDDGDGDNRGSPGNIGDLGSRNRLLDGDRLRRQSLRVAVDEGVILDESLDHPVVASVAGDAHVDAV